MFLSTYNSKLFTPGIEKNSIPWQWWWNDSRRTDVDSYLEEFLDKSNILEKFEMIRKEYGRQMITKFDKFDIIPLLLTHFILLVKFVTR